MRVVTDLKDFPPVICGLTLGKFDGVHQGHQFIFKHLRKLLSPQEPLVVYTFSNHPSQVLSPLTPLPLIYTLEHKLKAFAEQQVDYTVLLPFTSECANTPFDLFLTQLKERIPFKHLVLGHGARFGKNKEGNETNVRQLASQLNFQVDYVPKLQLPHDHLSSGHIRTLIAEGHFLQVKEYLGRPYSIYARLHKHLDHYIMHLPNLCLPPTAIYPIQLDLAHSSHLGRAHIDRHHSSIRLDLIDNLAPHTTPPLAEVFFLHE